VLQLEYRVGSYCNGQRVHDGPSKVTKNLMLTEQTFKFQSVAINANIKEKCFHLE